MQEFWQELFDPRNLFAHTSYVLLISSMMMSSIRLLRVLALGSGFAAIAHFVFQTEDYASLAWEIAFVGANLLQLTLLSLRSRWDSVNPDSIKLTRDVLKLTDPDKRRAVLSHVRWSEAVEGNVLIDRGDTAPPLIFIASGAASIERDGAIVGVCGEGDFLGEMSLITGGAASATVRAANGMRLAYFDRAGLERVMEKSPEIAAGFKGAIGRGMAGKIARMNELVRQSSSEKLSQSRV